MVAYHATASIALFLFGSVQIHHIKDPFKITLLSTETVSVQVVLVTILGNICIHIIIIKP